MPNIRSRHRKSTSITLDVKLLALLKEEAKQKNTNVSNLLEDIAREQLNYKKNERKHNKVKYRTMSAGSSFSEE